uniref:Uncharacterized protein n=1 Tax=Trichuris muris TaxID=70415 RepID=A0A5S6QH76_TRIMR
MASASHGVLDGELSVQQIYRWFRENLPLRAEMAKDLAAMEGSTFVEILRHLISLVLGQDFAAEITRDGSSLRPSVSDDKLREVSAAAVVVKFSALVLQKLGYANGLKFGKTIQPSKRTVVPVLSRLILYCMLSKFRSPLYQHADKQLLEIRNAYAKKMEELDKHDEEFIANEAKLNDVRNMCSQNWKQRLDEVERSLPVLRTYANKLMRESEMLEETVSTLFEQQKNIETVIEEAKEELNQLLAEIQHVEATSIDIQQVQDNIDAFISEQEQLASAQLTVDQKLQKLKDMESAVGTPTELDSALKVANSIAARQQCLKNAELEHVDLSKTNCLLAVSKDEWSKLCASRERALERAASAFREEVEQMNACKADLQTRIYKLEEEVVACKEAARRVEGAKTRLTDLEERRSATIAQLEKDTHEAYNKIAALGNLGKQRNAVVESSVEAMVQKLDTVREELKQVMKPPDDL